MTSITNTQLYPNHFVELAQGSAIDHDIINLNFHSRSGIEAYADLLISEQLPRTNSGKITTGWLQRYSHIEKGGWWCSGLDPLQGWESMDWGCFKPDNPIMNDRGKIIKYEHPPAMKTRAFYLRISLAIWQQISQRYQISIPDSIAIRETGEALEFWEWVLQHQLPVIVCEGVKKAAALLSLGYIAIAIPGITSGYRVIKDRYGWVKERQLIPELAFLAQHPIYLCFDSDSHPKTRQAVNQCLAQLGQLLEAVECPVKVLRLPGTEKGVDDFIVVQGKAAFDRIYQQALNLDIDLSENRIHSELTYDPAIIVNCQYLENLPLPEAGLVGIKSPKGTGKTTAIANFVKQFPTRPILLITHRIQLGKYLCDRLNINWIDSPENPSNLGLCFDSLWKINPQHWQGGIIVLDEIEQSLWHLLNSSTCKHKRTKLLEKFQQLLTTVLQTGGLVIAQDADLSDLSLEYLKKLSGTSLKPWIAINQWKPDQGWETHFYDSPNPAPLIQQLEQDLSQGLKCYVTTDSRSGRYSIETISKYLKDRLDRLQQLYPRTLLISSKTTQNWEKITQGELIKDYDLVFTTPSLGTGVSIDIEHFDRVYGIFNGVISDAEARQALARVRPNVPRYIWCAKRGIGLIGSGSKNYRQLAEWYQENQRENLALIRVSYKFDIDFPLVFDPIHLRTWAKFAARVNGSLSSYRQSMLAALKTEGHQPQIMSNKSLKDQQKQLRYNLLSGQWDNLKTRNQMLWQIVKLSQSLEKSEQGFQGIVQEINDYYNHNKLIEKSEQLEGLNYTGLSHYEQLLTHYYLLCSPAGDSESFRLHDTQTWNQQLRLGNGQVFLPDLSIYTLKIEMLRRLKLPQFLDVNRQFAENDLDLIQLKQTCLQTRQHLKRTLGLTFPQDTPEKPVSAILILSKFLGLLGLKLKRIKPKIKQDQDLKYYQLDLNLLKDGREFIFEYWRSRDQLSINQKLYLNNSSPVASL